MIPNCASSGTVIAQYNGGGVPELWRHWLGLNSNVQISKLALHICETLVADRALVGYFHVLFVALLMDTVTTRHKDYRPWRRKEIFAADRTVTFC